MTGIVIHRTLRPSSSPGRFSPAKRTCSGDVWGGFSHHEGSWPKTKDALTHKITCQCWLCWVTSASFVPFISSSIFIPWSDLTLQVPLRYPHVFSLHQLYRDGHILACVCSAGLVVFLSHIWKTRWNRMEPNEILTIWGPILNPVRTLPQSPMMVDYDGISVHILMILFRFQLWSMGVMSCPSPQFPGTVLGLVEPLNPPFFWMFWMQSPYVHRPGHHSGANMPIPPGAAPTCNASAGATRTTDEKKWKWARIDCSTSVLHLQQFVGSWWILVDVGGTCQGFKMFQACSCRGRDGFGESEAAEHRVYIYNMIWYYIYIDIFWIIRICREPFREPFLLGMVRSCAFDSPWHLHLWWNRLSGRHSSLIGPSAPASVMARSSIKLWDGHGWTPKQPWIKRAVFQPTTGLCSDTTLSTHIHTCWVCAPATTTASPGCIMWFHHRVSDASAPNGVISWFV